MTKFRQYLVGIALIAPCAAVCQPTLEDLKEWDSQIYGKEYSYKFRSDKSSGEPGARRTIRRKLFSESKVQSTFDGAIDGLYYEDPFCAYVIEDLKKIGVQDNSESFGEDGSQWVGFDVLPSLPVGRGLSYLNNPSIEKDDEGFTVRGTIGTSEFTAYYERMNSSIPYKVTRTIEDSAILTTWTYEGTLTTNSGHVFPARVHQLVKGEDFYATTNYEFAEVSELTGDYQGAWLREGWMIEDNRVKPSINWTFDEIVEAAGTTDLTLADLLELSKAKLAGMEAVWAQGEERQEPKWYQNFGLVSVLVLVSIALVFLGKRLLAKRP